MRRAALVLLAAGLLGCDPGGGEAVERAEPDTVTRAQRDSAVARSGLPGARGVSSAQDASSSAAQRAAQLDSIQ